MRSAPLSKADRLKLARLLALADSDIPDAREIAVISACRLVKTCGLTWRQVLDPPSVEHPIPERGTWRVMCRTLLAQPEALKAWERTFLADLPLFRRLSTKQRYCLKTIADRVLGADR